MGAQAYTKAPLDPMDPRAPTIVTGLGGAIDVASRPGEGATFTIRLPIPADRSELGGA